MALSDRRRARLVGLAKVALPLAALALLSTLFLLARTPPEGDGLAQEGIAEIARDTRADRPRLTGVAPDGTRLLLTAQRIRAAAGGFALEAPRLEATDAGGTTAIAAAAGAVAADARTLRLEGDVTVEAPGGLVATAARLDADLARGTAEAAGVTGTAPLGRIEAPRLSLERVEGAPPRLLFHGGVRVLYEPAGREGTDR